MTTFDRLGILVPVPSDFLSLSASRLRRSRLGGVAAVILGLLSSVPLVGVGIFYLETPRLEQQAFAEGAGALRSIPL